MKLPRRSFLELAAGAAALPAVPRVARAQTYPVRPVRVVVGAPSGGGTDIAARLVCQWLSERLGQSFVVENRPGAGTNIGTEVVVNSPSDGYTLLLVSTANTTNATLYDNLKFNFVRDIAPVAGIDRGPLVMVANPSVPAETVAAFIDYAKANPGKLIVASSGIGGLNHVAGELFRMMAGVNLLHVPYRGESPALTDLLGGRADLTFSPVSTSIEYIKARTLRALAVTTASRSNLLPDIPPLAEFLPGYEASQWYGVAAPRSTPAEIVDKLNDGIDAALTDPKTEARLADLGSVAMLMSPTDFGKLIADETEKWAKVIRAANIKPG